MHQVEDFFSMLHYEWTLCTLDVIRNIIDSVQCMSMGEMTQQLNYFIQDQSSRAKEVVPFATPELSMDLLPPFNERCLELYVALTRAHSP